MSQKETLYSISVRIRKMENLHIVFWLLKDISWCMIWKELGIAMVVPTLSVALWITIKNRHIVSELAHNLAIVFWITANGYWMISEFFDFDEAIVWRDYTGKHMAMIPFITGATILLYYYTVQRPKEMRRHRKVTM